MDNIKQTKIDALIPDDKNFNKGTQYGQHLIEESLRKFGAGRSILLDKNNRIIAGNKTIENAASLGMEDIVVVETTGDKIVAVKRTDIDLDTQQGREMALADNATGAANLSWDEDALKQAKEEFGLVPSEWGVVPEFSDELNIEDVAEDDFNEDASVEKRVAKGDLWLLGEHRLLCGDSTNADSVARLMQGELARLWLTDPPYNVEIVGGSHAISAEERKKLGKLTIQNDKMSDNDFFNFLHNAFAVAYSVMEEGASFYIWFASREYVNFELALNSVDLSVRQELIWNKNSLVMGRQDYQWKHEPCLYGWKEGAGHQWYGDRKQTTKIDWDRPTRSAEHPTMKPIGLFGYLISNSSKKGDIVLDTFGGSGTTLIACEQLERKCRMMELDPHYCDVIIKRWETLTGKKAVKVG